MEAILKDCCKSSEKRQALMDLHKKIQGRNRVLLDNKIGKMRSPVKIDKALYVETHQSVFSVCHIRSQAGSTSFDFRYRQIFFFIFI